MMKNGIVSRGKLQRSAGDEGKRPGGSFGEPELKEHDRGDADAHAAGIPHEAEGGGKVKEGKAEGQVDQLSLEERSEEKDERGKQETGEDAAKANAAVRAGGIALCRLPGAGEFTMPADGTEAPVGVSGLCCDGHGD